MSFKRRQTEAHRGEGHVMTETQTGALQPPAKGHQEPPGEEAKNILLWGLQREHGPATPWIWTRGLQTREVFLPFPLF